MNPSNTLYQDAMSLLKEYRQRYLLVKTAGGDDYFGIQVHSNAIMIDENVEHIKELLKDYNFKITGDTNSETITIK